MTFINPSLVCTKQLNCQEMFLRNSHLKIFVWLLILNLILLLIHFKYYHHHNKNNNNKIIKKCHKRNWNNEEAIKMALARKGPGEVGRAVQIDEYRRRLYEEYGYDAVLSDQISVNRSVPDVRPEKCKTFTYSAGLSKAAIIIIFYNERLSVLLRTVHGVINRSPAKLIHEIILVDDCSTNEELHDPLTKYLRTNLPTERSKVRLVRRPDRGGLMVARMTGARAASKKSEVLIFMDSHFEVNYNWLPPLLEPIKLNPKACTAPHFDTIAFKDFHYKRSDPFRGHFDWKLNHYFYKLHREEYATPAKNRQEYILMGAAIAIGAKFFWELGGFDEGMNLWGGEQFELSFKIWLCGGEIITVSCSRMAHLYRDSKTKGNTNLYGNYTFLHRNYRRLVDAWMDNKHREIVFRHFPSLKTVDPGDLTDLLAIRDRLHCKNFSWMMDNIMPDIERIFPPIEPNPLATGQLRSLLDPTLCISTVNKTKVILESCASDEPKEGLDEWIYNWRGEIKANSTICLESDLRNHRTNSYECHVSGGNQRWYYDRGSQWIVHVEYNKCMMANVKEKFVELFDCDRNKSSMKWTFTQMNHIEMDNWSGVLKEKEH